MAAFRSSKNSRSAQGAYEQPLNGGGGGQRRGFGPLDPDEAWDARVGHESDYAPYEQEMGGFSSNARGRGFNDELDTPYGRSYNDQYDEDRGRPRSRSPGAPAAPNPFDDRAAEPSNISLRGVSPRPLDTRSANRHSGGVGPGGSPTSERRSIFRENV